MWECHGKSGFSHVRCRQWKGKFKGLRPVFAIFHAVPPISGNSGPFSGRFAGFRTCATGARCPGTRKTVERGRRRLATAAWLPCLRALPRMWSDGTGFGPGRAGSATRCCGEPEGKRVPPLERRPVGERPPTAPTGTRSPKMSTGLLAAEPPRSGAPARWTPGDRIEPGVMRAAGFRTPPELNDYDTPTL